MLASKFGLFVWATSLFALISALPPSEQEEDDLVDIMRRTFPEDLEFIGVVEGKAYFANANFSENWRTASNYCRSLQLRLGTIETSDEWDFLEESLHNFPGGGVWTAARESRRPTMLAWNNVNVLLKPAVIRKWDTRYIKNQDYSLCAVFYSYPSKKFPTAIYPVRCTNTQRVLCETKKAELLAAKKLGYVD